MKSLRESNLDFTRAEKKRREVSLVPLIDVGFFLLIFFLIGGTIQRFEIIPVEVPVAKSGKLLDEGEITIILGRYEEILLGEDLVSDDEFVTILSEQIKQHPNAVITLKADQAMAAPRLLKIMDMIRAAGGKNISLMTQSL